jgi:hypothetical protein
MPMPMWTPTPITTARIRVGFVLDPRNQKYVIGPHASRVPQ